MRAYLRSPEVLPMFYRFHCIIRQRGTQGAEGIATTFDCHTAAEGKARLADELARLRDGQILTLAGLVPAEVQIFDNAV